MRIKQIPGHPKHCISDTGVVFSITDNGLMEMKLDISTGYKRVELDGIKYYVSRMVAEHFLKPPIDTNYKLFYIDNDKYNCRADNLVWLSPSDVQRYSQYTVEYRREMLGEW